MIRTATEPGFIRYLVGLGLGLACIYLCGVAGLYINLALVQGKVERVEAS